MPKTTIDYSKCVMYKIVCNDLEITDLYVGHTSNFTRRKGNHKTACINSNDRSHNIYLYQYIRNNGGWDNWCMIEVEKYKCYDGHEARARERYWVEVLNAKLNRCVPNRKHKEWVNDNLESQIEKRKEYYHKNVDHILDYKKEYREKNKDKIKEEKTKIITCCCGCQIVNGYKHEHIKTKKHLDLMKELNN